MLILKISKGTPVAKMAVFTIVIVIGCINLLQANRLPVPEFSMPNENFTDSGYMSIKWEGTGDYVGAYQLEQGTDPNFQEAKIIYEGPDRASFVSGLPDGKYYFRVRAIEGNKISRWSPVVVLVVKHHSLAMAFGLATVGIVVFLLTVAVVVKGIYNDKKS